jgi:hypothetical protein
MMWGNLKSREVIRSKLNSLKQLRTKLKQLLRLHFRHLLALALLSLGPFLAFFLVDYFRIGGIRMSGTLLGVGLLVAALGQSLFDFGRGLQHRRLEYSGTFFIGLSWWVWSLNPTFLSNQHGAKAVADWLVPFVLFGMLPPTLHYINNELLSEFFDARIFRRKKESSAIPVLIIEPGRKFGRAFKASLIFSNYSVVDWVIGIASLEPLVGILPNGRRLALDPSAYQVALIDSQPYGRVQGCNIVKTLKGLGITCVGISTERPLNEKLVAFGAKLGVQKHVLLAAMLAKILTLDEIVNLDDLTGVKQELETFGANLDETAREPANSLLELLPEGDD